VSGTTNRVISFLAGAPHINNYPLDGPIPELPTTNAAQTLQRQMVEMAGKENLSIRQSLAGSRKAEGFLEPNMRAKRCARI